MSHLMAVAALVLETGGDENQAIAALLHDAVEDQGGAGVLEYVTAKFGSDVAQIVSDCTEQTASSISWRERKQAYISALPAKPRRSLLVALADKTHNAEAIAEDLRIHGEGLWNRFNGGPHGTRWYYLELARVFENQLPCALSLRLARAVAAIQA